MAILTNTPIVEQCSYTPLKIGEGKTHSKTIEDVMNHPLSSILYLSSNINDQVKSIIDKFVQSFLSLNVALIRNAYRTKTSMNDLHYSIVLKTDNMTNRNKIFAFLDGFDLLDISGEYPIYFQFVPAELADKIPVGEVLNLKKSK